MNPISVFDKTLIQLGNISVSMASLLAVSIIIIVTATLLYIIKKAIYSSRRLDLGKKYSLNRLTKYVVILFATLMIAETLGANLSIILAGSAALLVGVGLGLKNIFSDFISGLVLLVDSSVKVGDVIEVDGFICQVKEIKMRTTMVVTRDERYILLPNTHLTNDSLINWTYSKELSRFDVKVRVDYKSDIVAVSDILKRVAESHKDVLDTPPVFVRLSDFGEFAMDFTVYFWCNDVFRVENTKSDIRRAIFAEFEKHNISIPFPQRVIHNIKPE